MIIFPSWRRQILIFDPTRCVFMLSVYRIALFAMSARRPSISLRLRVGIICFEPFMRWWKRFATAFLIFYNDVELNRYFRRSCRFMDIIYRIRQMSADGSDDFVRRRVFFRIEDYANALQILRRKIAGKFLVKDVYNCRILHILVDSSVRCKYSRRVLFIIITAFD